MTQTLSPRKRPKPPMMAGVLAELAVAGQRHEIGDQRGDVIEAMRPLRMARDLRLLPRRQFAIEFLERLRGLAFDAVDLLADGDGIAVGLQRAQFLDLGLELGHRFFEVEIGAHHAISVQQKDERQVPYRSLTRPSGALKSRNGTALHLLLLRQRMQIAHQALQPLFQHMGIDLRGGNIGVAEQRLHHAQIGAVVQEVAGEGVAQHVRADLRGAQPGGGGERLEFAREMLAGEVAALAEGGKQPFRCRPAAGFARASAKVAPSPAWRRR